MKRAMLIERAPVEIQQAGHRVGTGLCDADPPSYVRVSRIAWTRVPDLSLHAEFHLDFGDGRRRMRALFDGSVRA
ncbi:MAG TPA: hypothetical protein VGL23_14120, partial [Chloroflexota bacterium]